MKKALCCLLVLQMVGWSIPSFAEDNGILQLSAVTTLAGGGGIVGSVVLPLTTSTTTSAGVGFILSSLNQSAPAPKKQSQALNDYLMLHQDQFAMHVTLGAGASLNALMQVMKTPAAEHARWFKAIRRHRKPLLMVLRMPPGIERGEAFYHLLRQIQDTI